MGNNGRIRAAGMNLRLQAARGKRRMSEKTKVPPRELQRPGQEPSSWSKGGGKKRKFRWEPPKSQKA